MGVGGIASSGGGKNIMFSECTAAQTAVANEKLAILRMHRFVLLLYMIMHLAITLGKN